MTMSLSKIITAAVTKFSTINMVQYIGIATLILTSWSNANLVSPSFLMLVTGVATLVLKAWHSSKEMVSTGFKMDWGVWFMGGVGALIGLLDTFIANGEIMGVFGKYSKAIMMSYMALTVIIRTGYSNQSLNTVASHK